jgi:hypothetical protein
LVQLEVEEFVGVEIPEGEFEVEVDVEFEVEVAEVVEEVEVGEECPICLDEFDDSDEENKSFVTDCGHKFHGKCLERWLRERDTCPSCRKVLVE